MILILIIAFVVLMPLAMWHDWLDNYEMNNPEKGQVLRNVVAYTVTGVFFLWILWYGTTH